MSIIEKIKNAQTTLGLLFATVIIIPYQLLLLFWVVLVLGNYQTLTVGIGLSLIPSLIGYFAVPIILCTVFSIVFQPKRIVSPINVQIGTSVGISMILLYNWGTAQFTGASQAQNELGILAAGLIILSVVLVVVGLFQFIIVRSLVGINLVSTDRKSYSIDGNVEAIDKVIRKFLDLRGYTRELGIEGEIMYERNQIPFSEKVILALGPDPRNKNHSILATVAFHKGPFNIKEATVASDIRDSIIFEMSARLLSNEMSFDLNEIKNYEFVDPVSAWAYTVACEPTVSRIAKIGNAGPLLRKIPLLYRSIIAITVFALIGINAVYWTSARAVTNFDFNEYVGLMIFLLFALPVEVGIPLREEVFKKKDQQLE